MANLIRGSPRIKGDLLPGSGGLQAKARSYADDTTLLLKDSRSLASLFELIDLVKKGTGAKLNRSKPRPCGSERGNFVTMNLMALPGFVR